MRGQVTRVIFAECGSGFDDFKCGETTCGSDDDIATVTRMPSKGWTVASMKRYLAEQGWVLTSRFGWVCAFCARHVGCKRGDAH